MGRVRTDRCATRPPTRCASHLGSAENRSRRIERSRSCRASADAMAGIDGSAGFLPGRCASAAGRSNLRSILQRPLGLSGPVLPVARRRHHLWVFDDQQAFDAAEENTLNPPRWVMSERSRGRRVPLPSHLMIDIKGTFIRPGTGDIWVDDFKLDRACDLFRYGFS